MRNNFVVSVDWVSLFGVVSAEHFECDEREGFRVEPIGHGSKIWKHLFRVQLCEGDGKWRPFGTIGMHPWFEKTDDAMGSGGLTGDSFLFKVDNAALYETDWLAHTINFFNEFGLTYKTVSRADIAVDFCQLKNHVTGKMIVKKLKALEWWKAGQNKVVEVYRFPYHLKKCADGRLEDGWSPDEKQWMSINPEDTCTESLTFGTHSSICQVQLYDKTKELERVTFDGVCSKEYIKTRWTESGILRPNLHVWRLEFRLSSRADCVCNRSLGRSLRGADTKVLRKLSVWDLDNDNLYWTFSCVQNSWFKLFDATCGGRQKISTEYIRKMKTHKDRLPVVRLFDDYSEMTFKTHKYQENPTRFVKILVNALSQRAIMIENGLLKGTEDDVVRLKHGADALRDVYLKRDCDGLNDEQIAAWRLLGEYLDAEEAEECDFESNLQLDLFDGAM